MTAIPQPSNRRLTISEYAALGEPESGFTELQKGRLLMSPSPTPDHMIASGELFVQLREQIPINLRAIQDVDIDLELRPAGGSGTSRRPDLIVVDQTARKNARSENRMLRASEVLLVVEIVSYGSRRLDNVIKRAEYADAGIPRYWIVDIEEPVSLVDCHLTEQFGYMDGATATGTYTATEPFPMTIELDRLV